MRVLYISTEFPPGPGGIASMGHSLATEFRKDGCEVYVIAKQEHASEAEIEEFNVSYYPGSLYRLRSNPSLRNLKQVSHCRKVIRKFKPDVIIGSGRRAVRLAWLLGVVSRIRTVAIAHGSEFGNPSRSIRFQNRIVYGSVAEVIANSHFTMREVLMAKISPRRQRVIHLGANHHGYFRLPDSEIQDFKKRNDITDQKVLLTVGSVTERKGQRIMVMAMPEVLRHIPEAHYYCVGEPLLADELMSIAKELGIAGHVHFLGRLPADQVAPWVNACDLFVLTSVRTKYNQNEGFGIAVVEAALCGKTSVVSTGSGLVEAIVENVTGVAVPQNDPKSTAHAVVNLLMNDVLRHRMERAAMERALNEQTWQHQARLYLAELKALMA